MKGLVLFNLFPDIEPPKIHTMPKADLTPYQQNLAYRRAFAELKLAIEEVMEFTPLDLDLENRRLKGLLDFVRQYRHYGSQKVMEAVLGEFLFPPIFPGISPESDWYRFEEWLQGRPVRAQLATQLPQTLVIRDPAAICEEEIEAAVEGLANALHQAGFGVSLNEGIPARLVYSYLFESLGETVELIGGGWTFDGCSGYCPDCFQRPWCDSGQSLCWSKDEEAGKIHLINELQDYVSPSPQSLAILLAQQAEQDASYAKFAAENPSLDFDDSAWKTELN